MSGFDYVAVVLRCVAIVSSVWAFQTTMLDLPLTPCTLGEQCMYWKLFADDVLPSSRHNHYRFFEVANGHHVDNGSDFLKNHLVDPQCGNANMTKICATLHHKVQNTQGALWSHTVFQVSVALWCVILIAHEWLLLYRASHREACWNAETVTLRLNYICTILISIISSSGILWMTGGLELFYAEYNDFCGCFYHAKVSTRLFFLVASVKLLLLFRSQASLLLRAFLAGDYLMTVQHSISIRMIPSDAGLTGSFVGCWSRHPAEVCHSLARNDSELKERNFVSGQAICDRLHKQPVCKLAKHAVVAVRIGWCLLIGACWQLLPFVFSVCWQVALSWDTTHNKDLRYLRQQHSDVALQPLESWQQFIFWILFWIVWFGTGVVWLASCLLVVKVWVDYETNETNLAIRVPFASLSSFITDQASSLQYLVLLCSTPISEWPTGNGHDEVTSVYAEAMKDIREHLPQVLALALWGLLQDHTEDTLCNYLIWRAATAEERPWHGFAPVSRVALQTKQPLIEEGHAHDFEGDIHAGRFPSPPALSRHLQPAAPDPSGPYAGDAHSCHPQAAPASQMRESLQPFVVELDQVEDEDMDEAIRLSLLTFQTEQPLIEEGHPYEPPGGLGPLDLDLAETLLLPEIFYIGGQGDDHALQLQAAEPEADVRELLEPFVVEQDQVEAEDEDTVEAIRLSLTLQTEQPLIEEGHPYEPPGGLGPLDLDRAETLRRPETMCSTGG